MFRVATLIHKPWLGLATWGSWIFNDIVDALILFPETLNSKPYTRQTQGSRVSCFVHV